MDELKIGDWVHNPNLDRYGEIMSFTTAYSAFHRSNQPALMVRWMGDDRYVRIFTSVVVKDPQELPL